MNAIRTLLRRRRNKLLVALVLIEYALDAVVIALDGPWSTVALVIGAILAIPILILLFALIPELGHKRR